MRSLRDVRQGADPEELLLVEDDPDLAENLAEIVEGLGYRACVAHSAEEGLRLVSERSFRGLITDFRLPGMNGVELIERLRRERVGMPAVVLSAFADARVTARAEEAGALDVLTKPVALTRLFALLDEIEGAERRVLIVEDNLELAENVAEALRARGLAASIGTSGDSALAQRTLPAVALVDVRLPDTSGVALARRLSARDPRIKILFVTAHADECKKYLERGIELKFLDSGAPCLLKPFDLDALVDRVQKAIE